jgi:hypothetical protein
MSGSMNEEPGLQMGADEVTERHICQVNGRAGSCPTEMGIVWFTDGSKSNEGTGAGVYGCGTRMGLSSSL